MGRAGRSGQGRGALFILLHRFGAAHRHPGVNFVHALRSLVVPEFQWNAAYATSHWKFASTITETEYRYRVAHLTWAQRYRPDDPTGHARKPVDAAQMPLPNFERENRP